MFHHFWRGTKTNVQNHGFGNIVIINFISLIIDVPELKSWLGHQIVSGIRLIVHPVGCFLRICLAVARSFPSLIIQAMQFFLGHFKLVLINDLIFFCLHSAFDVHQKFPWNCWWQTLSWFRNGCEYDQLFSSFIYRFILFLSQPCRCVPSSK